ncbi:hypothetical protein GCM10008916_28570 [Clostridium nitritogenes]|uniref:Uncharacterized protein n=1 Tax=Clostridium nitritogenes TaxID=83340 RepID=A0ABP3X513_9CLOT
MQTAALSSFSSPHAGHNFILYLRNFAIYVYYIMAVFYKQLYNLRAFIKQRLKEYEADNKLIYMNIIMN